MTNKKEPLSIITKKILTRVAVSLIGLILFIILIVIMELLGLPIESYINQIEYDFSISVLLFCAFLILILGTLGVHLNYKYGKWLKSLSPEERKIKKENCKIADEIIKYIHKKYGDDHNLELVNAVSEKNEYSMIYKKSKDPQKVKISFNRKNKIIEESYTD